MVEAISFVLSNFTLTFLLTGFIAAAIAITRAPKPLTQEVISEKLLAWHIFFAIGVTYFYNFVMHSFFGEMAARFIGWEDSPFQFEVGTASLGFSIVGFLAAFRSFDMRLAAILGPSIFALGAAAGHIYQMVTAHNFAPGNAGIIFYTDFIIPLIGFALLWWKRRTGAEKRTQQV
jgi:hypothetical protein